MKYVLSLMALVASFSVLAAGEQKVCVDKKDAKGQVVKDKDGKPAQDCKVDKVHKKSEGTPVPEKK